MNFSNQHRNEFIQQLTSQTFDVLVIGGGITGAGIALDGTLRGLKIALIDVIIRLAKQCASQVS